MVVFIQTVTNKSSDKSNLAKFVSLIIEETVPSRFAYWAIELVCSVIHNKPGKIQDACSVLIQHLQNPEKCRNVLFIIERAVQKEADFFRVDCETGSTILVHISGVKELELRSSIYLYHTCDNLYASVAATSGESLPLWSVMSPRGFLMPAQFSVSKTRQVCFHSVTFSPVQRQVH
jgi:hypothetical protein